MQNIAEEEENIEVIEEPTAQPGKDFILYFILLFLFSYSLVLNIFFRETP